MNIAAPLLLAAIICAFVAVAIAFALPVPHGCLAPSQYEELGQPMPRVCAALYEEE